jgi:hypothetical protein
MDLGNFEMTYFWQIFNTNLNKIIQRNLKRFKKIFSNNISRISP